MIRAKQLGNLSNNARSIFLSGSRCNAADGSSCTCSEDDTCPPKKQQPRNTFLLSQKGSPVVPKNTRADTSVLRDAGVLLGSHKVENRTLPQILPSPVRRPDTVSYASNIDTAQNGALESSPLLSDQFVKAGIAAVGFLSDMVNYKLPLSDGPGKLSAKNSMMDPTIPISSIRSSNVKPVRRENFSKIYPKPSSEVPQSSSSSSRTYSSRRDKSDKSGSNSVRGVKTADAKLVQSHTIVSDACDRRRTTPGRPKSQTNRSTVNLNPSIPTSNTTTKDRVVEDYRGHPRDVRMPVPVTPTTRGHFMSSGFIVENVSQILRQIRWGPAAEQALSNLNYSMDAFQANQVLKKLQDHTVALGFFHWLKSQPGFKHDGHTYTTMVGILGRAKQFGAIHKLLDQMAKDGCQPNVVTYNRLIHSYGRANYLKEAVDVFNQMQEVGCEPDRVTYCTLIDIHAKAGYLDFAMEMYQRMQAAGLSPDTFTYSVIINCLGKAGHLAAAHRLFCEMVGQGCVPNLVTYNIMIALQAKARNYQSALKLYRDMQGAGFEPDKVTYSIVMEVLGHCGYLEEAEAVFSEMKRKNWVPDEPVYGLLVDLWGKAGNVEKAWEWYHKMLGTGLRPNVPTCNSLLSAFLRVHRLGDAYNLLQSMHSLGLNPSLQTYTLLLSCCTDASSPYDMGVYCQLMEVSGHPAHAFLLSLPSAGPDGQNVRDHASKFLDLMHSEDRESKRGLVDAVVDFLHKSGLKEEAGSVWEVAAQKNVYPDTVKEKSSCYWLINLHVMSDGTAVTALSRTLAWFRHQMLASGVCPTRIDIVTGWGRRSRVTGSSMVRHAVQELLDIFSFPFFTENGNSGCFVGCGEPLSQWLHHSCVDRMHLL